MVEPNTPLADLLRRLSGCADGRALVVDDDGHLVGIVSSRDLSHAIQTTAVRDPSLELSVDRVIHPCCHPHHLRVGRCGCCWARSSGR